MKNFPIKDEKTGREYWISRSVAVLIYFVAFDRSFNKYILATQRGEGTPDPEYIGSWCMPCGYVEFDETIKEGAARELFEERGIKYSPENFHLLSINDNPKEDKRQNITFRYKVISDKFVDEINYTNKYSEEDEVSNIRFIPIEEVNEYKWAFNHNRIIYEQETSKNQFLKEEN